MSLTITCLNEIGMANMNSIINTKTNGEDNIGTDNEVNADVKEMEETNDVNESETNGDEDDETDGNACQHDQGHKKDTHQSKPNILNELLGCDSLCFPGGVDAAKTESPRDARKLDYFLNFVFCRNILASSIKAQIFKLKFWELNKKAFMLKIQFF